MAEETKYIPYGQDEISQQELQTALANDLPNFVSQYKWLQKPKNRDTFLKIYSDMVNGLTGASNDSGLWSINTSNDMNSYLMSPREKEIAEHAAYYIQQQMAKMTPKAKAEEAKKEDLTPFNFQESFGKQLLNLYGGDPKIFGDSEQGWNSLDARGANGLRGTEKRKKKMAEQLELYRQELANGKDYNFEGTSFKDKQDALTKLQAAIDALRNTPNDESDDLPAFSALGLNYRNFFSNGGNEELTLEDGRKTTYQEYYQAQKKKLADEAKAKAELAKQQRANQYDGYKYFNVLNGTPLNPDSAAAIVTKLKNNQQLDGNDISGLSWIFKNAMKMGGLENLSKEELAKMPRYAGTPTRLKKISGVEGIYYDTVGNKFIRPYKNTQQSGVTLQTILDQNSPEAIAKNKELEEQKKIQQANNRKLGEFGDDWKTEDYLRMGAMAQDIAGGLAAWAPVYGTATSAGLGVTSMLTNLSADAMDDSLTKKDVAKNVLINTGLGLVGMVPGLGLASRTGKWLTNIAKWAPRLLTLQAIKDLPDSYNSLQKAINNPKELTNQDWKNIAYGLSVAAGLSRGAAGIKNDIKYKQAFKGTSQSEQFIKTKNGKEIKVTDEQLKKLNEIGHKEGTAKANEYLQKELKAGKDEVLDFEFKTGKLTSLIGNSIKTQKKNTTKGLSPQQQRLAKYYELIQQREEARNPRLSRFTNYNIYKNMANFNAPSWRNPFSNFSVINPAKKFKGETNAPKNTPKPGKTTKEKLQSGKESLKEIKKLRENIHRKLKKDEFGGTLNTSLDTIIEDFIKNNNI